MPPGNTCERHVGRLLEIRIDAGYRDLSDVNAIFAEIVTQSARLQGARRLVVVTDWRMCSVIADDAAAHLATGIRGTNAQIERSGALLPVSCSVAMLQFARLLRASDNPDRRGFSDPVGLIGWLSEVLTPDEVARLYQFIG